LKSDSGRSGSVFSKYFDSGFGSEGKTQNPAEIDFGALDPWPRGGTVRDFSGPDCP